jgi:CubicO group peptidase (beta-lactamase class C family)
MKTSSLCLTLGLALLPQLALAQADCDAPPVAGKDRWKVGAPEIVGMNRAGLCAMVPPLRELKDANVHAVLVVRHGTLVFEQYFSGVDEKRGTPLGVVTFGPETQHDLRSVSKSIVALVFGIALERGWVKTIDQPVLSFFPEYADLRTPEKDRITLRHLLTMSAGLAWDESLPYTDPANSETRMDAAADRYRYALAPAAVAPAGQIYNYNGGGTELLAGVLRKVTGKDFDVLAREVLFAPLDISEEWNRYPDGQPIVKSGLRMRARDLAKIGQLMLQRGAWNGAQIVPASWIDDATTPHINGSSLYFYGYQFWLGRSLIDKRQVDWAAGNGNGGQRVFVVPAFDLVVVVNAGHYNAGFWSWVPNAILNRAMSAIAPGK